MRFKKFYKQFIAEFRAEHLTLKEVESLFDVVLKACGVYELVRGPYSGTPPTNVTPGYLEDKEPEIARETVRAFKARIHPMYRDDLERDGYGMLVKIADNADLWISGDSDSRERNADLSGSQYNTSIVRGAEM